MKSELKKTILIVHNYYQIPGGEDTVVANEKRLLEENGYKVFLYTRHNNELKKMNILRKICLPFTTIFNPRTYRDIKKLIQGQQIEIVHVHNTLNLISPAVYYAAVKYRIPVVQTIHNFRFLCPGATFYRDGCICEDCINKGLRCAVQHRCYRGSVSQTLICVISMWIHRSLGIFKKINYICLTEFNKEKLLQFKQIKPDQIYIKPNFTYVNDEKMIAKDSNDISFSYVGRLDELKGIKILFNAWGKLGSQAPRLDVCGSGPLEEWCYKYIKDNGLKNIIMHGAVSNEKARDIISLSDAIILPTLWYEGFPMTIVESFSVGTAVIGSEVGNVGCLIQNGVNGYIIKVGSVEDLVNKVVEFKPISKDIIVEIYNSSYSKEKNIVQLENIYSSIANHTDFL